MASGGIDVTPGRVLGDEEIVTPDKLNDIGQPVLRVQAGAITTRELADGSISSDKLDVDLEAQLGVADGSVTTNKIVDEAVTTDKIEETARIPVGVIMDYAGSAAPTGWLLCYGQEVSRSTFSDLFLVIGVTFGAGDNVTTFNLPDLRGMVCAGKDDMGGSAAGRLTGMVMVPNGNTLGGYGGGQVHSLTANEGPSHQHTGVDHLHSLNNHYHATQGYIASSFVGGNVFGAGAYNFLHGPIANPPTTVAQNTGTTGAADRSLITGFSGGGASHNNTQPTLIMNKIIRH